MFEYSRSVTSLSENDTHLDVGLNLDAGKLLWLYTIAFTAHASTAQ